MAGTGRPAATPRFTIKGMAGITPSLNNPGALIDSITMRARYQAPVPADETFLPAMNARSRIPRTPFARDTRNKFERVIPYLKARICPCCHGGLTIDIQDDSVFAFCDRCKNFDVSLHMDVETREVLLGYSSMLGPEGFMDPEMLSRLAAILVRKEYLAFQAPPGPGNVNDQ